MDREERIAYLRREKHVFVLQEIMRENGKHGVFHSIFEGTEEGEKYARQWAKNILHWEPDSTPYRILEITLTINLVCPDGSHPAEYIPGECELLERWYADGVEHKPILPLRTELRA